MNRSHAILVLSFLVACVQSETGSSTSSIEGGDDSIVISARAENQMTVSWFSSDTADAKFRAYARAVELTRENYRSISLSRAPYMGLPRSQEEDYRQLSYLRAQKSKSWRALATRYPLAPPPLPFSSPSTRPVRTPGTTPASRGSRMSFTRGKERSPSRAGSFHPKRPLPTNTCATARGGSSSRPRAPRSRPCHAPIPTCPSTPTAISLRRPTCESPPTSTRFAGSMPRPANRRPVDSRSAGTP